MIRYATYQTATGEILGFYSSPEDHVAQQCNDGEEFFLNITPESGYTHIINNEPVTIVPEPHVLSLEEVKAEKLAELAAARYTAEIAGITINGACVCTDRQSQALLTGAYLSLKSGFSESKRWKGNNGWITVTLADLEPIARAVDAHVQACFDREGDLVAQVEIATTSEEVAAIVW